MTHFNSRRILPFLPFFYFILLSIPFAIADDAEVKTSPLFSDGAVLQADMPLPVWGWADEGVEVTVSFAGQTESTTATAEGTWRVTLKPVPVNKDAQVMTINDKEIKNILVGEVWLCSGQSNMEWNQRVCMNPKEEAKTANYPLIRHVKIGKRPSSKKEASTPVKWVTCTPGTVGEFTGAGYYFARRLHTELDVPIGLLNSTWGGTRVEPWTPEEGFKVMAEENYTKPILKRIKDADPTSEAGKKKYQASIDKVKKWVKDAENHLANGQPIPQMPRLDHGLGNSHQDPTRLYRGMIHPLIPYAIKGVIWYQGESNGGDGELYMKKLQGLIQGWRELWGQGDFPFYFVQLANFQPDRNDPAGAYGYARVREGMRKAQSLKNTGMAVIIDIGEANDIHPRNKQDVGGRLAQWALAKDYGKDIVPCGPLYVSHGVEKDKIRISFDHVGEGLMAATKNKLEAPEPAEKLERFAIAGNDKKWVWADAVIDGETVLVSSKEVPEPVAVRYAYSGNPEGAKLYNKEGIPASPFRTDDW